jgi:hypothetical protein
MLRESMPAEEFDAVDFFVHEPGRTPPPAPQLGLYLSCALSQPHVAERLPGLLDEIAGVLAATVPVPMEPGETECTRWYRSPAVRRWRGRATLRWLDAQLRSGDVEGLTLSFTGPADGADRFWYLDCAWVPDPRDAPFHLSMTPSETLWPEPMTDAVAERLLDLLRSWTETLDVLTGCVTYDRIQPGATPWELWYGANLDDIAPGNREHVRGYYWANLLTARHVERSGGMDRLSSTAAEYGFVVQPVPGARAAVLVRDPGPVTGFDDDRLARMKQVLQPVLPDRRYTLYEGWPLRIVRDPGTAFRRVPPGQARPSLR